MAPDPLPVSLAGAPPQVYLASPSPFYLTGEEELRLSSLANVGSLTLTVTGRILRPDNTISRIAFTHAPNSNRTIATSIVALSEGWLLGLTVRATSGAPAFGQVWVNLELLLGAGGATQVMQTLGSGFLTANTPYSWPGGVNYLPLDGPGNIRSITGTNPGGGVNISETVPTGARWELLSFRFRLNTGAAAGNRTVQMLVDDSSNNYAWIGSTVNFSTPSSFCDFDFFPGAASPTAVFGNAMMIPAPIGLRLAAAHRIKTTTQGLDVGDTFTLIQYLVREWMSGE